MFKSFKQKPKLKKNTQGEVFFVANMVDQNKSYEEVIVALTEKFLGNWKNKSMHLCLSE